MYFTWMVEDNNLTRMKSKKPVRIPYMHALSNYYHEPYNRGILVYNICLISISNSVSNGATNKSVLNIESS